jgi:hypothetical protein
MVAFFGRLRRETTPPQPPTTSHTHSKPLFLSSFLHQLSNPHFGFSWGHEVEKISSVKLPLDAHFKRVLAAKALFAFLLVREHHWHQLPIHTAVGALSVSSS